MIGRFVGWIGGSFLTGALALASSGAGAPQHRTPVATPKPEQCVCAPADCAAVIDDMGDAFDAVDMSQFDSAALALDQSALALDAQALAFEAAQDAQESQEGTSVHVFSSSTTPGWLGIRMEEITSAKAKELNLPAERGVVVASIAEDSPAARAGLKVGDVITDFDGQRIEGTLTLQRLVHEVPAGRKVSLSVWRDGRSQSLTVEIGSRHAAHSGGHDYVYVNPPDVSVQIPRIPAMPSFEIGPFSTFRAFGAPALGIDAEDLSGQLGNYFGAPEGEGILVREVMPGLPAEKAGLKAGDVIVRIDGKRVKEVSELRSALRDKLAKANDEAESGKAAAPAADLTILRSGKESTVRVELQQPMRRVRPGRRVAV